jgi:hypothetical protein
MAMPRLRPAAVVGVLWLAAGCGLRSNALDDFDGEIDLTEGSEPDEQSSCAMPKGIPAEFETFMLTGQLRGSGSERGPCGRDEGPEGVYAFSPSGDVEVSVRAVADETSFGPTIRVERDLCGDPVGPAEICASDFIRSDGTAGLARHFLARAGSTYYVTVDSPEGTSGRYGVELRTGPAPIEQCSVHNETITYSPGGTFSWLNDFTAGNGRVSSRCGAPGKENMFRFVVGQSGWVSATATGHGGYVPVVSLRRGCSVMSELECQTSGTSSTFAQWFVDAGEYYLVIDNAVTAAGGYQLFVEFG